MPSDPVAALRTSLVKAREAAYHAGLSRNAVPEAAWSDVDAKLTAVKAELEGMELMLWSLAMQSGGEIAVERTVMQQAGPDCRITVEVRQSDTAVLLRADFARRALNSELSDAS